METPGSEWCGMRMAPNHQNKLYDLPARPAAPQNGQRQGPMEAGLSRFPSCGGGDYHYLYIKGHDGLRRLGTRRVFGFTR